MTELSPLGTIAPPGARWSEVQGSGRAPMGLDMRVIDADGTPLREQHGSEGQLQVRGASVVDRYFLASEDAVDADGWFDTGDLASFDEAGHLSIRGRAKDLIKSGGEWINPAEMEDIIGRHPAVRQVAVVARPDGKWGERPVLFVELHDGEALDPRSLLACLQDKVAKWWLPDAVFALGAMPLAATGKIDKQRLRAQAMSADGSTIASD
jgi:fatty-acyl-CoA synthase